MRSECQGRRFTPRSLAWTHVHRDERPPVVTRLDPPSIGGAKQTDAARTRQRDERRRAQEELSRRHILDAAESVFSRRGLHEATVRDIAAEADFSTGALYKLFESKDDILFHVMERRGRTLLEELEAARATTDSAREQLRALAETQIAYYSAHRDFYRLILRTAGPSWWTLKAEFDDTGTGRFRRALDLETATFAAGIAEGEFVDDDPEQLAVVFQGIMQAYLTRWLLHDGDASTPDTALDTSSLFAMLDRAFNRADTPRKRR